MSHVGVVTTVFPTMTMFIEAEVAALHRRGHRVTVFCLRPPSRRFQPEHAWMLPLVRHVGSPVSWPAWRAGLALWARRPGAVTGGAARVLAASLGDPYALAGHLGYLPAAFAVAEAARRDRIDRLHGAWAHFPASVAYLAARWSGARFSFSAHAGADLYRSTALLATKVRAADFVATCNRGNWERLVGFAPDAAARIHCIHHGVNLERFDGSGRRPAPEPVFLSVGSLTAPKGFAYGIEAVARLKAQGLRVRYWIVGEGPGRSRLERLIVRRGLGDQVELRGELPQSEILPLHREAWALVHPSVVLSNGRRDGIPNAVVEAMAMGLPCVGSRAAGLPEIIQHGATGYLAAPRDAAALAAAMRLVAEDRARAEALGQAGRDSVRRHFDVSRNLEALLQLFERPVTPATPGVRGEAPAVTA